MNKMYVGVIARRAVGRMTLNRTKAKVRHGVWDVLLTVYRMGGMADQLL